MQKLDSTNSPYLSNSRYVDEEKSSASDLPPPKKLKSAMKPPRAPPALDNSISAWTTESWKGIPQPDPWASKIQIRADYPDERPGGDTRETLRPVLKIKGIVPEFFDSKTGTDYTELRQVLVQKLTSQRRCHETQSFNECLDELVSLLASSDPSVQSSDLTKTFLKRIAASKIETFSKEEFSKLHIMTYRTIRERSEDEPISYEHTLSTSPEFQAAYQKYASGQWQANKTKTFTLPPLDLDINGTPGVNKKFFEKLFEDKEFNNILLLKVLKNEKTLYSNGKELFVAGKCRQAWEWFLTIISFGAYTRSTSSKYIEQTVKELTKDDPLVRSQAYASAYFKKHVKPELSVAPTNEKSSAETAYQTALSALSMGISL